MLPALLTVLGVVTVMIVLFGIQQYLERSNKLATAEESGCPFELSDLHTRMVAKHNQIQSLAAALKKKDRITVSDLMTEQVTVLSQDDSIARVRELMKMHRTRHLLVQDENDLLIGIISDRDVAEHRRGTAKQLMTPDPTTVSPERPISDAVGMVLSKRISCLPVVDGVRLCGVLTSTDLLVILECLLGIYEESARNSPAGLEQAGPAEAAGESKQLAQEAATT